MTTPEVTTKRKRAVNLSVNAKLLGKAKRYKLNLSAMLEKALADEVRNAERAEWLAKNKTAIAAANKLVETAGLFSDDYRKIG